MQRDNFDSWAFKLGIFKTDKLISNFCLENPQPFLNHSFTWMQGDNFDSWAFQPIGQLSSVHNIRHFWLSVGSNTIVLVVFLFKIEVSPE